MADLQFKYVRIQGLELARNTMYGKGVFSMCWQLIQDDVMVGEDQYQVAARVDGFLKIEDLQESWSPE